MIPSSAGYWFNFPCRTISVWKSYQLYLTGERRGWIPSGQPGQTAEENHCPCPPSAWCRKLVRSGNDPSGKHVVVCGRSNIVGKPLAAILMQKAKGANAVVTVVHTGAKDIAYYTKQADILVAAMGRPQAITADMVREGTVVIDVGVNRIPDSSKKSGFRLAGDVDYGPVSEKASFITPVPGGVGPMTVTMLLYNTVESAIRLNQK